MFHVRSQSARSTVVFAENAAIVDSRIPGPHPRNSALNVMGFVMSLMVRLPSITNSLPSQIRIPVDSNRMTGYFSVRKKSPLLRWPSLISFPVVSAAAFSSTPILESSGFSAISTEPSYSGN